MGLVSYAQHGEDVVLWRALGRHGPGSYVDVGAGDPVHGSVTKVFSDAGWSGINVEPGADAHARLSTLRPRDVNLRLALDERPGRATLHHVVGGPDLSTTDAALADRYRAQGWTVERVEIEVDTLARVCEQHAPDEIHFLKVDVEGREAAVLAGADFTRFRPWVVVVEAVRPEAVHAPDGTRLASPGAGRATHRTWEPDLLAAGYEATLFDGINRFYVAAEHAAELRADLEAPANPLDGAVTAVAAARDAELAAARERIARLEHEVACSDARLAAMEATWSWRVTAPLRALRRAGRRT